MAQVKDFVAAFLVEIQAALEQPVASEQGGVDLPVLLRYESRWALAGLMQVLQKNAANTAEISPESMKPFLDFLRARYDLIKNTDAIYNHNLKSPANIGCVMLAKSVLNALKAEHQSRVSPSDPSCQEYDKKHYYDYLFPGLNACDYVSSRGTLGALELKEFFFGDDGTPIETLECLKKYREAMSRGLDSFPPHVCLPPDVLARRENDELTAQESKRLGSHSLAASQYAHAINAVNPKKTSLELDVFRDILFAEIAKPEFIPGYTYNQKPNQSNTNLLKNGYFDAVKVVDLKSLAALLQKHVLKSDWIEFIKAIDPVTFDHLVLPKLADGAPDSSILLAVNDKKFEAFLNAQPWSADEEVNRALLFVLTELYIRGRYGEGAYTGFVGQVTGLAHNQKGKEDAAAWLQRFFTEKNYLINQLPTYLKDTGNTVHLDALTGGRLRYLTDKANKLGPGLKETTDKLAVVAEQLSIADKSQWKDFFRDVPDNSLQAFIDSSGGLINCIQTKGHYRENDQNYNKAILFIMAECYLRIRRKADSHGGGLFGRWGHSKDEKVNAVEVFKAFLISDYPLNQLSDYLNDLKSGKIVMPEYLRDLKLGDTELSNLETVMRDNNIARLRLIVRQSELGTLVSQAEKVCTSAYYAPEAKGWYGLAGGSH